MDATTSSHNDRESSNKDGGDSKSHKSMLHNEWALAVAVIVVAVVYVIVVKIRAATRKKDSIELQQEELMEAGLSTRHSGRLPVSLIGRHPGMPISALHLQRLDAQEAGLLDSGVRQGAWSERRAAALMPSNPTPATLPPGESTPNIVPPSVPAPAIPAPAIPAPAIPATVLLGPAASTSQQFAAPSTSLRTQKSNGKKRTMSDTNVRGTARNDRCTAAPILSHHSHTSLSGLRHGMAISLLPLQDLDPEELAHLDSGVRRGTHADRAIRFDSSQPGQQQHSNLEYQIPKAELSFNASKNATFKLRKVGSTDTPPLNTAQDFKPKKAQDQNLLTDSMKSSSIDSAENDRA